ncbi:MAG: hypothetical protein AMXMBFR82_45910 [Candidatus Hydrogenedentota bacterium]
MRMQICDRRFRHNAGYRLPHPGRVVPSKSLGVRVGAGCHDYSPLGSRRHSERRTTSPAIVEIAIAIGIGIEWEAKIDFDPDTDPDSDKRYKATCGPCS